MSTQIKQTEYKDTLSTIEQAGFINQSDLEFLKENIATVQENWAKQQVFRTETEMNVSVLDNLHYPTYASKYWQCIRESGTMYQELVRGSFEYRRNEVEIKKIEVQLKGHSLDKLDRELLEIDLEEKLFTRMNSELQLKDRMREIKMWHNKMEELKASSDFDSEDVNTHQLVSYALRFQRQIELMQANGGAGMSQGEMDNLIGQFQTVKATLEDRGLLSEQHPDFVANQGLPESERMVIKQEALSNRLALEK